MTARFIAGNLDLSTLPAPNVIKAIDYETILFERIARLKGLWPDLDTANLETEPGVILEQVDAYRETLTKIAINDAARAVMLAFATGSDLENLAAFYGVQRLVISPATLDAAAVTESDGDLRTRIQLAPEQLPYAGMTGGGYRALALRVAPSVKDVTTIKRDGGRVDIVLLGRTGNGAVASGVVSTVYQAFQDDAATQLTDIVTARSADIVPYNLTVDLTVRFGPDPAAVAEAARASISAYAESRHAVGAIVYKQMIEAAASVGGVEHAVASIADINPGTSGAAYMASLTVNTVVVQ